MTAALPTVLVAMPFLQATRPSIQLGLLKAIGRAKGCDVRTLHANLDFAARIGLDHYRALAEHRGPLVGEWLFSVEAFGDAAPDHEGRLPAEFADELGPLVGTSGDFLTRIREQEVPAYLDRLVERFPWQDVRVVGFSSTYQQNTASFALANRLKRRFPGLVTVFGGANFEGEMGPELVRSVGCIDYAVTGEGDLAFPELLSALAGGTDPGRIPGVLTREGGTPPVIRAKLDANPAPDYDEYFEHAAELGIPAEATWLPFESARGCWWGAKHHCTFCGLNGTSMRFRAKSPERVRDELGAQARRYGTFRFEAVDNIMDAGYLRTLLPAIAEAGEDYELFYEVKANLGRAQLRLLAQAGVTRLQPGLESLSSHVLSLMDKGVRAAQNVNLLRWARYYGITVSWNILWGFPGETAADYRSQAALARHLVHLQPPASADRIWLERFSPLSSRPERFPLRNRRPERSYEYVYPSTMDLDRIAYFFDYEPEESLPPEAYAPLREAVGEWSRVWDEDPLPSLVYRASSAGYLRIYDARGQGRDGIHTFHDTLARIYLACVDRPTTASAVLAKLDADLPAEAVEDAFRQFAERGLMVLDGRLALALALPATPGR